MFSSRLISRTVIRDNDDRPVKSVNFCFGIVGGCRLCSALMEPQKKPKRSWVYLSEEDQRRVNNLLKAVGTLNEVTILSTLASAAFRACEESDNGIPLPLNFRIVEGFPEKPTPVTKPRR